MTEEDVHEFVALIKDGECYLRYEENRWNGFPSEDHMRFDAERLTSYDEKWGRFASLPTAAEEKVKQRLETTGYKLKDGFEVTEKTPATLPLGAFYDCETDEQTNHDIRGLYTTVIRTFPVEWTPAKINITVIDMDCAPIGKTKYPYESTFPNSIKSHPLVRHKHACHIDGKELFAVIAEAVKEKLPGHCRVTSDYNFSLTVVVDMPVSHKETTQFDVSGPRATKPRWKTETLRGIEMPLINICTPDSTHGQIIKRLKAANYAELEKAIDETVQSYIDLMDERPVVCPHCHGYGWLLEAE